MNRSYINNVLYKKVLESELSCRTSIYRLVPFIEAILVSFVACHLL